MCGRAVWFYLPVFFGSALPVGAFGGNFHAWLSTMVVSWATVKRGLVRVCGVPFLGGGVVASEADEAAVLQAQGDVVADAVHVAASGVLRLLRQSEERRAVRVPRAADTRGCTAVLLAATAHQHLDARDSLAVDASARKTQRPAAEITPRSENLRQHPHRKRQEPDHKRHDNHDPIPEPQTPRNLHRHILPAATAQAAPSMPPIAGGLADLAAAAAGEASPELLTGVVAARPASMLEALKACRRWLPGAVSGLPADPLAGCVTASPL